MEAVARTLEGLVARRRGRRRLPHRLHHLPAHPGPCGRRRAHRPPGGRHRRGDGGRWPRRGSSRRAPRPTQAPARRLREAELCPARAAGPAWTSSSAATPTRPTSSSPTCNARRASSATSWRVGRSGAAPSATAARERGRDRAGPGRRRVVELERRGRSRPPRELAADAADAGIGWDVDAAASAGFAERVAARVAARDDDVRDGARALGRARPGGARPPIGRRPRLNGPTAAVGRRGGRRAARGAGGGGEPVRGAAAAGRLGRSARRHRLPSSACSDLLEALAGPSRRGRGRRADPRTAVRAAPTAAAGRRLRRDELAGLRHERARRADELGDAGASSDARIAAERDDAPTPVRRPHRRPGRPGGRPAVAAGPLRRAAGRGRRGRVGGRPGGGGPARRLDPSGRRRHRRRRWLPVMPTATCSRSRSAPRPAGRTLAVRAGAGGHRTSSTRRGSGPCSPRSRCSTGVDHRRPVARRACRRRAGSARACRSGRSRRPLAGYIGATARARRRAARLAELDAVASPTLAAPARRRRPAGRPGARSVLDAVEAAAAELPRSGAIVEALRRHDRAAGDVARPPGTCADSARSALDQAVAEVGRPATGSCAALPPSGPLDAGRRSTTSPRRWCGSSRGRAAATGGAPRVRGRRDAPSSRRPSAARAGAADEERSVGDAERAEVRRRRGDRAAGRAAAHRGGGGRGGAGAGRPAPKPASAAAEQARSEAAEAREQAAEAAARADAQVDAAATALRMARAEEQAEARRLAPFAEADVLRLLRCPPQLHWPPRREDWPDPEPAADGTADSLPAAVIALHEAVLAATSELSPTEASAKQSATRLARALDELSGGAVRGRARLPARVGQRRRHHHRPGGRRERPGPGRGVRRAHRRGPPRPGAAAHRVRAAGARGCAAHPAGPADPRADRWTPAT